MTRHLWLALFCTALTFSFYGIGLATDPVEKASMPESSVASVPVSFIHGQADRREWESWLEKQTGDRLNGANFWASHRSLRYPPECANAGGPSEVWVDGCRAARAKLSDPDRLRHESVEYKRGWNAYVADSSTRLTEPPIASARKHASWLQMLLAISFIVLIVGVLIVLFMRIKSNAEEQLKTLLLPGETVIDAAMQHRLYALFSRRNIAASTTGRFIFLRRHLLGGFTMFDMRWQDIKDAKLSVGMFSAAVRLHYSANLSDTAMNEANTQTILASGLVIAPAQAVYRECQAQEQSWREKRRVRTIEEMRAKAGGVQIATGVYPGFPGSPDARDAAPPMDALTHKLSQARDLKDQGLITDSEYEAIKARVVQSL